MAVEKRDPPLIAVIKRLAGALWPILFVPPAIVLVRSGVLGPYQRVAEDIADPLITVTLIYASFYVVFWIIGLEHVTSVLLSGIVSIVGVVIWQAIAPAV